MVSSGEPVFDAYRAFPNLGILRGRVTVRRPMGLDRGVWASRLGWVDPLVSLVSLRTRVYHGSSGEMMADFGLFRETATSLRLLILEYRASGCALCE